MDLTLTSAVSHTPWDALRRSWVIAIRREFPGIKVVSDYNRAGCWPTARRAWKVAGRGTHHMVLADDMLPVRSCHAMLMAAIAANPEACLCLFTMRGCAREAVEAGKHWAITPDGVWGGATVMPTAWIHEWLEWDRKHLKHDYIHDDTHIAIWLAEKGYPVWHLAPSIVEHVGAAYGLHPNRNRVAAVLAKDGEVIDWTAGLKDPIKGSRGDRVDAPDAWIIPR